MQTLSANKVLALMGVDANTAATGFQFHEVGSNPSSNPNPYPAETGDDDTMLNIPEPV
jgi:hypothetical protein